MLPDNKIVKDLFSKIILVTRPPDEEELIEDPEYYCYVIDDDEIAIVQDNYRVHSVLYPCTNNSNTHIYEVLALPPRGSVIRVEDITEDESQPVDVKMVLLDILRTLDNATFTRQLQVSKFCIPKELNTNFFIRPFMLIIL